MKLPEHECRPLDTTITFRQQQINKWIDLSVQNAFDNAKENGYDFIELGTPTKEIAIDMKEKDCFLEDDELEDIEAAIERYRTRLHKTYTKYMVDYFKENYS